MLIESLDNSKEQCFSVKAKVKNNKNILIIVFVILFIIVILAGFSWGFISHRQQIFPYQTVVAFYDRFENKGGQYIDYISDLNILDLVKISNENDIFKKRKDMIQYIWKQEKLPEILPKVDKNIKDELDKKFEELEQVKRIDENIKGKASKSFINLKQVDRLTANLKYGFQSEMYHFIPEKSLNKLVIFEEGHDNNFTKRLSVIVELIKKGFDVITIEMPTDGFNNRDVVVESKQFGRVVIGSHNAFALLDSNKFSSLEIFLEPAIQAINYANLIGIEEIDMIGISGGGWATDVISAIDSRIKKSYSISGAFPIFLRLQKEGMGDYEMGNVGLLNQANYLEMFILGSYGEGRKHIQIINFYDPVQNSGNRYKVYEEGLYNMMSKLGKGEFKVFVDDTHREHKISEYTLKFILQDLE